MYRWSKAFGSVVIMTSSVGSTASMAGSGHAICANSKFIIHAFTQQHPQWVYFKMQIYF